MGRRALPKIDRSVNVDQHLVELEALPSDWDPQSIFSTRQPLEIEVGTGKGLFLLNESARQPDRNFLGNEIAHKYARFAAYRLAQHQRTNARVVSGDGLQLFHEILPDDCAVAVHVYFPDPWWKARHRRRRVMQPTFIKDMQRVLVAGGVLHFWSDVEQYFDETCELVAAAGGWSSPELVPEPPAEHDMDYRTHFERRMRKNGHDVFRARFTLRG